MTTRFLQLALTLPLLVMLAACGSTTDITEATAPLPTNGGGNGGGNGGNGNGNGGGGGDDGGGNDDPSEPAIIGDLDDENALLVVRSMTAMSGQLAVIGQIATAMVREGAGLLDGPLNETVDLPECNQPDDVPNSGSSQIFYTNTNAGFQLPPGPRLEVSFMMCRIEGIVVDGFMYITAMNYGGNPGDDTADWNFSAEVVLGPVQIPHPNGTTSSFLDSFEFSAQQVGGVLTVDIEAAADEGAGMIGGLNAQHHLGQINDNSTTINFQFRPYRITMVDDANVGDFRISVHAHSTDGHSMLERYTGNNMVTGIRLRAETGQAITWNDGRPASLAEVPDGGSISFIDNGATVRAEVQGDEVVVTYESGEVEIAELIAWDGLITAPLQ